MMQIEIWSDIMCPFCYIGKRKLENALNQFAHRDQVEIVWKSFQLNPYLETEPEKSTYQSLAEHKGISLTEARQMTEYVTNMAQAEGLTFDYDKAVVANSFDAHRLIQMAKQQGKGDAAEERLFQAYFTEGANIADRHTLVKLGSDIGLEAADVEQMLRQGAFAVEVKNDIREAQRIGVRGVPFFVLNRKYGVSGAQPAETLLGALNQAYSEIEKERSIQPIDTRGASCDVDGRCD